MPNGAGAAGQQKTGVKQQLWQGQARVGYTADLEIVFSQEVSNMAISGSWVGVNFSNTFQSKPVDPDIAVPIIVKNNVLFAKTFGYLFRDLAFIHEAYKTKKLKLAVGIPNSDLQDLANDKTSTLIDTIRPFADAISWLCVGNEPLAPWNKGKYNNLLVNALSNVRKAVFESPDLGYYSAELSVHW
jgi:hypothetical protein